MACPVAHRGMGLLRRVDALHHVNQDRPRPRARPQCFMYTDKHIFDATIIGGGPAGMMAAGRAASLGARVLLLEKNRMLGKKLSITGGGRCNITNAEENVRTLLGHYSDTKEYLHSPFSQFGVQDTFSFFEEHGLPLVVEARKRAFPKTQKAPDVTKVMEQFVRKNGVEVHLNARVREVDENEDDTFTITTKKGHSFTTRNLIIAAGGLAAPETGSTGDGFAIAEGLGHRIIDPDPTIVPLTTDEVWVHKLSGVGLSFMRLSFIQNDKIKIKKLGKLLFTHFGISGPLVLNSAHEVQRLLEKGPVMASVDLFPDTDHGALDKRILKLFEKNKNKQLKNIFDDILPKTMVETVLSLPHLDLLARKAHSITKEERSALVHTIKDLCFPITGALGFEKAVITRGGVVLNEVNTKSMQSKCNDNLYLIGDTLNINRPSGGYSLQLCWTTGWVAGTHIGKKVSDKNTSSK